MGRKNIKKGQSVRTRGIKKKKKDFSANGRIWPWATFWFKVADL